MPAVVSRGMFEVISRINWDVFGHLTFAVLRPRRVQFGYVWRLVRHASTIYGRSYREVLVALRYERGEVGGRPHFHLLLGGIKPPNLQTLGFQLIAEWKRITPFRLTWSKEKDSLVEVRSRVVVRPYMPLGGAEGYLMKECGWTYAGANGYELAKFDRADEATLSRSVFRCLRIANCIEVKRRHAAHKAAYDWRVLSEAL